MQKASPQEFKNVAFENFINRFKVGYFDGRNVISSMDYYEDSGAREVAHGIKKGDKSAMLTAAKDMAKHIPDGYTIIPTPSSGGKATDTLIIANMISEITGAQVADIVSGEKRKSLYDMKKSGENIDGDLFHYTLTGEVPEKAIILDTVFDTGRTISAVSDALGGDSCIAIVHSHVNKNITKHSNRLIKDATKEIGQKLRI
ncbi:hypothetical protein VCHA53O466_50316 [Vibrio chagasii]|nr:hypothetical protein VCHA53O466_50316 [Vibrio chagasii]